MGAKELISGKNLLLLLEGSRTFAPSVTIINEEAVSAEGALPALLWAGSLLGRRVWAEQVVGWMVSHSLC